MSCVFPNPTDPAYGIFVFRRAQSLAKSADVRVIAPVPALDYSRLGNGFRTAPVSGKAGSLDVLYPRWFYPPGGGAANPAFLFMRLLAPVFRLHARWPFDLLDAHFGYPDGIAAALLALTLGVPFSVTLRGNEPMHAQSPLKRALLRWSLHRADLVVCVSHGLKRFALETGARPSAVVVIPNGVDPAIFYRRDRSACRARHGIPNEARVVLSAGSLIERKGHHRIVEALAMMDKDVQLIVVGSSGREGDFEGKLRAMIHDSGMTARVRMFGPASPDTLAELMSAADLLCLASTREGSPNVVLESLASGTPVVATETGAIATMTENGRYGIAVPVGNPEALRQALNHALDRQWDGSAMSAWAHSRSWDSVGREVFNHFRCLTAAIGSLNVCEEE